MLLRLTGMILLEGTCTSLIIGSLANTYTSILSLSNAVFGVLRNIFLRKDLLFSTSQGACNGTRLSYKVETS